MSDRKQVWIISTGIVDPRMKRSRDAAEFVAGLEGFVAVHPSTKGTLWLFDSKNNAKGARNLMEARGIRVGWNICRGWLGENTLHIECADN